MNKIKYATTWDGFNRLQRIKRWVSYDMIHEETVASHIFRASVVADKILSYYDSISDSVRLQVMRCVLYHEMDEAVSTDIPYTVRECSEKFERAYIEITDTLMELEGVPKEDIEVEISPDRGFIIFVSNLADTLACIPFLQSEIRMGNDRGKNLLNNVFLKALKLLKEQEGMPTGLREDIRFLYIEIFGFCPPYDGGT